MNPGPKYKDYEDQAKRERSFMNYPKPYPLKEDLVRAGFFYLGSGAGNDDDCQCYYCGVRLFNWTKEDDPLKEHEKFRPNCFVIKSLRNPLNIAPPMNIHPTENTKFPGIETKIQNTQIIYEPQPGTMTNPSHPKQNIPVSNPYSKEDFYSFQQNPLKSDLAKLQRYQIGQGSQELETPRMETPFRHNYSSQLQAPPTNQQLSGQIAYDNIRQRTPNPNANISSTNQPHNSGRIEIRPQEPIPRQFYYPITQRAPFLPPQTVTEQATFGNQQPPSLPYATNQNPYSVGFQQPNYQSTSDPSYGSNSLGNVYSSLDHQLLPHPILNVGPHSTQPETQNIHSVQTQYPLNQANMNSNIQSTRFPQQLVVQTSLDNPMLPQVQNYLQNPQNPRYQQYQQYP